MNSPVSEIVLIIDKLRCLYPQYIPIVGIESTLNRIVEESIKVVEFVPSLPNLILSMRETIHKTLLQDQASRLNIALLLKAAFELVLISFCTKYSIKIHEERGLGSLGDKLDILKTHIKPASRLNAFYDLKNSVNAIAHPKGLNYTIELPTLDDNLHDFLKVLKTAVEMAKIPITQKVDRNSVILQRQIKAKTKICSYWSSGNVCPHKFCHYAHGEEELKKN